MKVLHIIAVKEIGGAERHFISLLSGLEKRGVEAAAVCIPCGTLADELINKEIKVFPVKFSGKWNPSNISMVVKVIDEFKPDIVHTHLSKSALIGGIAGKLRNVRIVSTKHNLSKGWYYRLADKIIAVSEIIKTNLIKSGFDENKITTIYNGIEADFVTPFTEKELLQNKGKYGINKSLYTVGIIARLADVKQHHIFLKAAKMMIERGIDVKFILCGDGILKDDLKRLVIEMGIENDVIFTGFIKDVQEIYSICNLTVLTSKTEGMPMTVIESMAFGVPVIAPRVGGIPEIIKDGENGLLFESGNVSKLAEMMTNILCDEKLMGKFSFNAKRAVKEKFMADAMVDKTVEVYRTI